MNAELSTVSFDSAVFHHATTTHRYDGLRPATGYSFHGVAFRTLERPHGELIARFATVNDVHFGERVCGYIEGFDSPVFSAPDGAEPYPTMMNRHAIDEIRAIEPDAVVVKGDLTSEGRLDEYREFTRVYGDAFGERLHCIRGNHEVYSGGDFAPRCPIEIDLPGVVLAVIDTSSPGRINGSIEPAQLEWLDEVAARAGRDGRAVMVFGHHHIWNPDRDLDTDRYFGIRPRDSERLIELFVRRPQLAAYAAGHTHRNRVVRIAATGARPWIEVASVKDFPGSWAEYLVFEGGVVQVHHRISAPEALAWTDLTRGMYAPAIDYAHYAFGALDDRCFRVA